MISYLPKGLEWEEKELDSGFVLYTAKFGSGAYAIYPSVETEGRWIAKRPDGIWLARGTTDTLEAAKAAAEAHHLEEWLKTAKPVEWLPIETAPKDGSHIQLYRPEIQFVGYWAQGGADCWCSTSVCEIRPAPTHWLPLPSEPVDSKREE